MLTPMMRDAVKNTPKKLEELMKEIMILKGLVAELKRSIEAERETKPKK